MLRIFDIMNKALGSDLKEFRDLGTRSQNTLKNLRPILKDLEEFGARPQQTLKTLGPDFKKL